MVQGSEGKRHGECWLEFLIWEGFRQVTAWCVSLLQIGEDGRTNERRGRGLLMFAFGVWDRSGCVLLGPVFLAWEVCARGKTNLQMTGFRDKTATKGGPTLAGLGAIHGRWLASS
jgi:hypothetical protein